MKKYICGILSFTALEACPTMTTSAAEKPGNVKKLYFEIVFILKFSICFLILIKCFDICCLVFLNMLICFFISVLVILLYQVKLKIKM